MRALLGILPFAPFIGGLVLSIGRFRARDPLGGLLFGEAGFVLMIVLAVVLDRFAAPTRRREHD